MGNGKWDIFLWFLDTVFKSQIKINKVWSTITIVTPPKPFFKCLSKVLILHHCYLFCLKSSAKKKFWLGRPFKKNFLFAYFAIKLLSCSLDSSITYKKLQRKTFQNFVFSTDKTVDKKKANHIKKDGPHLKIFFEAKKFILMHEMSH